MRVDNQNQIWLYTSGCLLIRLKLVPCTQISPVARKNHRIWLGFPMWRYIWYNESEIRLVSLVYPLISWNWSIMPKRRLFRGKETHIFAIANPIWISAIEGNHMWLTPLGHPLKQLTLVGGPETSHVSKHDYHIHGHTIARENATIERKK